MDSPNDFMSSIKTNLMKKLINYTDAEYYLLKFKPDLDADERKFVDTYENVYIMQGISLLAMIPSAFYIFRVHKYRSGLLAGLPGLTSEGLQKINKKLLFYLSFGTVLAINSQIYSYTHDLPRLMKEVGNREKQAFN